MIVFPEGIVQRISLFSISKCPQHFMSLILVFFFEPFFLEDILLRRFCAVSILQQKLCG